MLGDEVRVSPEQVAKEQSRLHDQVGQLLAALDSRFGDTVTKGEVLAAGEAHRALKSLAQMLGMVTAESGDAPMADAEAWRAGLEGFVARRVGEAVQSDVGQAAEECRQEVDRLRKEELAPLAGRVDDLRENLDQSVGGLQTRLGTAQAQLAEAGKRLDAAEGRQAELKALMETLSDVADDLRTAVARCSNGEEAS